MNAVTENKSLSIDLLKIKSIPATLNGNFQELNKWLDGLLDNKVTVVTEDTLASEKKVVAELRKLAKEIDAKTKEIEALVSTDIVSFKDNMKALKAKVTTVADDKADQVKALEDKTREEIREKLVDLIIAQWDELKVDRGFRDVEINDLIKLTAITASGALTKASVTEVTNRVKENLALQTKIYARLMSVENKSLRAELNPPLTEVHVKNFLYADDFDDQLDRLIQAEVARKIEQEKRLRAKLEDEKQREIDAALDKQKAENEAREKAAMAEALAKQKEELAKEHADLMACEKLNQEHYDKTLEALQKQEEIAPLATSDEQVAFKVTVTHSVSYNYYCNAKANVDMDRLKAYYINKTMKDEGYDVHDKPYLSISIVRVNQ